MSLLLLDTTFLVDADRGKGQLDAAIGDNDDVAICAVTLAELRVGVNLSSGRAQQARAAFLADVLIAIPIIDYDRVVAESHADLLVAVRQQGRPRGAHDLIIAATARATRRIVVTTDAQAFQDLPDVTVASHR